MFRFLTSGESHGKSLTVIIDGYPHGVPINEEYINSELRRRMMGYGRGGRMKIEADRAEFISGVRKGISLGSPICIRVENRDYENWVDLMEPFGDPIPSEKIVIKPRPGHADLAGVLKKGTSDVRDILERASARETAARVAAGAMAKIFLSEFDISIGSVVTSIGKIKGTSRIGSLKSFTRDLDSNPFRMVDDDVAEKARETVDNAKRAGDTVGGSFQIHATGVPPGLGEYSQWDRRIDGLFSRALVSIPAIKGVEVGEAIKVAKSGGLKAHDRIYPGEGRELYYGRYRLPFKRKTNHGGGIEGGMTNGEDIVLKCYMKPIPTLTVPLESVSIETYSPVKAVKERSDVCAVPAASIVGESMVAIVLAEAFLEKFGCDSLPDIKSSYENYLERICAPKKKV